MSSETSDQKQAIRDRIDAARQEVAALREQLDAVDGELASLSALRHQYQLLGSICGSLEELRQLGADALFWGESSDAGNAAGRLRAAQQRIEAFDAQVSAIEERRREVVECLESRNEHVELLGYDLVDLIEEEESRNAEWIIEREEDPLPLRVQVMPWARGVEEDWRFRRALVSSMAAALLIGMLLPLVDIPIPEREELIEVPERVASLIREQREIPPPAPVVEEPPPEPKPLEPEPEPVVAEERPEPVTQPVTEAPVEEPASPKEKVQSKGLLAFRESFAKRAQRPSAQLGSQAHLGNTGDASVGRPERSMVTTMRPGSSGGINLASISRDIGGGGGGQQIAGVEVTRVASSIGGEGAAERPLAGGQAAGRTDEEIQIVFDRYKAALYRLYNRELRKDPTLRGQLVVRLTIEPDGSVSLCRLESSDMHAPQLASKVVERIRGFDFGAKEDVTAMTIIYPIDFLPAA